MGKWKALIPGISVAMGLALLPAWVHADSVGRGEPLAKTNQLVATPAVKDAQRTSRGFGFIRAGKAEKAIAEFDAVIAASERRYLGDTRQRFCARDERESALVIQAAGSSGAGPLLIDPAVCDAHFGKGFALIDMGRGDLAEAELRRATELAPFDAHYANEYAELSKTRRDWKASLAQFTRAWDAVDKNPQGGEAPVAARALRGIGYNQMMLGNLDEAERHFRKSLQFEPGNKAAGIELAYIARKKAIGS